MAAVGVHDIEMVDCVALKLPVETGVGDLRTAGRRNRLIVGTLAVGELFHRPVLDGESADLAAFKIVIGVRRAFRGQVDPLTVAAPGEAPGALPSRMIEVAAGDLPRRAAGRRDDEEVAISGRDDSF